MEKQPLEQGVKVESFKLELPVPERYGAPGYVDSFLFEHKNNSYIMGQTNIHFNDRCNTVSKTVYYNVSLVSDAKERERLWKWYDEELADQLKKNPDVSQDEKIQIEFRLACLLQGKITDFLKKYIDKPLLAGTE